MSANMQNIMKAQTMGNKMAQFMMGKKVFELNVNHNLVKFLDEKVKSGDTDNHTGNIVDMLYETALLTSGYGVDNPHDYARKVYDMLCSSANLTNDNHNNHDNHSEEEKGEEAEGEGDEDEDNDVPQLVTQEALDNN
jgi:molecular chaperone HtpG